jgi:GNAT superfamily N-acetyltransferase
MIRIEALHKNHNRSQFDCGTVHLNRYLQQTARQHADKGMARTFVLIDEDHRSDILGFFTLMGCEIRVEELPAEFAKKYPPVAPAAKLARLAVSKLRQRQGLGQLMIIQAMQRVLNVSDWRATINLLPILLDYTDC